MAIYGNPLISLGNGAYVGTEPAIIPPYDYDDDDNMVVDPTKYCWIGGVTQFKSVGTGTNLNGSFTAVQYGYANGTTSSASYKVVLTHQGRYQTRPGAPGIHTAFAEYDCMTIASAAVGVGGTTRICVDTHGNDDYTTYPTSSTAVRYKLSQDLGTYYTLDNDWGLIGQWSRWGMYSLVNNQRVFQRDIGTGGSFYCSTMATDNQILTWMEQGYVYPWVNYAYDIDDFLSSGLTASHQLNILDIEDEPTPIVDWGWVAGTPDFSQYFKVNRGNSWKDVQKGYVYVNGSWKKITDYYVMQGGSWKQGASKSYDLL